MTCNFLEIWVYDMDHPLEDPQKILLANLPKEISRLGFLVDTSVKTVREKEMDISIKAGRIVGDLYKSLLKRYEDGFKTGLTGLTGLSGESTPDSENPVNPVNPVKETCLAALNRLCVRLVFCFYAEDAEIFPKDCFWKLLTETPAKFLRDRLIRLFRTLDTPEAERDPYLEPELAAFPYTNGGLFRGVSDVEIPPLDDEIRELLIKSSDFDWRDISPTIFGALFESTLNPETRRAGGMVYTSVENIHKVIDPLFMNDLTTELESIKSERAIAVRRAKAMSFQDKLGSLTFLDPACGSGNFLTETFLSLRKLENIDYVSGWYWKAAELGGHCAFVSTNSICQGEQVASVWRPLVERFGLEIDFAHRTFRWDNESFEKAHVHCVIVGFHVGKSAMLKHGGNGDTETRSFNEEGAHAQLQKGLRVPVAQTAPCFSAAGIKTVFDNGKAIPAAHINGYLMDAQDVWIESRTKPLCDVPEMRSGGKPVEGGHLILTTQEKDDLLRQEPKAETFLRQFMGSEDYIHNETRWCLWLKDVSPAELRSMPKVLERVQKVRDFRLASVKPATRQAADTPWRFMEIKQPNDGNFILVPKVSSETRHYVPIGFMTFETVISDLAFLIPAASLYHFGVLTSSVHMAWMRVVAGRLKSDYRYSAAIVYNNFPWPTLGKCGMTGGTGAACGTGGDGTRGTIETSVPLVATPVSPESPVPPVISKISQTAQTILDVRARYPDSSLADLYDPLTMPPDLRAAHTANDRAVLAAYGLKPDTPEPEIVAHLFKLYAEMTANA